MEFKVQFDKRAIDQLGREVTQSVSKEIERENDRYLNGLVRQMQGQPVEEIEAELRRHYRGNIDLPNETLAEWAQVVHDGGQFDVRFRVK